MKIPSNGIFFFYIAIKEGLFLSHYTVQNHLLTWWQCHTCHLALLWCYPTLLSCHLFMFGRSQRTIQCCECCFIPPTTTILATMLKFALLWRPQWRPTPAIAGRRKTTKGQNRPLARQKRPNKAGCGWAWVRSVTLGGKQRMELVSVSWPCPPAGGCPLLNKGCKKGRRPNQPQPLPTVRYSPRPLPTWELWNNQKYLSMLNTQYSRPELVLLVTSRVKAIRLKPEVYKVHIFWEGHKILRNLHLTFVQCSASQK